MPLLHKKPFSLAQPPDDLVEDEEIFLCKVTGEIFRDYDEFCERVILCNSLVWSCALTGRSHLTYQEALASETKVKKLLKRFPMELRTPVLYLASLCERRSLVELAEDVFNFVKNRFFIGETVQVKTGSGEIKPCHILSVVPPSPEEVQRHKQSSKNGEKNNWIPASLYVYEVEAMDESGAILKVKADQIFRKKSAYNKDKNRLYIKQFVHLDSGFWKLKESSSNKYGISRVKFDNIFAGEPPCMVPKKSPRKSKKQETLNKYFNKSTKPPQMSPRKSQKKDSANHTPNGKVKRKRRTRKEMEAAAAAKLKPGTKEYMDAKLKARAVNKEKKQRLADFIKDWQRKRDDLECEDLKELPVPHAIECRIPNEYFGDVVMIMEFLNAFKKVLPLRDFFPYGINFELIERALVENEVAGPFNDIMQLLLTGYYDLCEQEAEEIRDTDVRTTPIIGKWDSVAKELIRRATGAESWIRKHHGASLPHLSQDASTITEILRLHILAAGSKPKDKVAKWRFQARGGYRSTDDPWIDFKMRDTHILEFLSQKTAFDLPIGDKICVLTYLQTQILTLSSVRDIIDEGVDKARQHRIELRKFTAAEVKREKEEALRQKELKKEKKDTPNTSQVTVTEEDNARALRSAENSKKDQERVFLEMSNALAGAQLLPIGSDRAYRRFWVFPSLPGLFVEHKEENAGPCLPKGTPQIQGPTPDGEEDNLWYIKRLFEEGANKENFSEDQLNSNVHMSSPNKKLLAEKNGADSPAMPRARAKSDCLSNLICWGDSTICPVHSDLSQSVTWSFYKDESDISRLIESLNPRGIRERKLRLSLIKYKDSLVKSLPSCPVDKLNPSLVADEERTLELRTRNKIMKQYDNANLSYPQGTPLDMILENTLRDLILETEEKVNAGGLGLVKVRDRNAWRKAIAGGSYDRQAKRLNWGGKFSNNGQETKMEVDEEGEEIKEEPSEEDGKEADSDSRSSTPSLDISFQGHIGNDAAPINQRQAIADLASAILQVEQCIEHKYLQRPLGLDSKERDRPENKYPTPAIHRWETALMEATSIPQLFLHLSALDNSVMWARSALHAFCRICRGRKDPENMLLCDTCNKGHHLYCLKPKLTKVPSGDWHCPKCKPKEKVTPVKRKRHFFVDDDDDEEEEIDDDEPHPCKGCHEDGAQLICDTCDVKFHLKCVIPPVRKVPKSKWFCHECRLQGTLQKQEPVKKEPEAKAEPKVPTTRIRVDYYKEERNSSRDEPEREKFWTVIERDDNWSGDGERSSRRRCSKAATAKISQFAKQLRSTNEEGDEGRGDGLRESSRRKSRRSYETSFDNGISLPLDNAALQEILEEIMHHKDAWPFLRPVSKSEVPDYHLIIKKPMDFGTIKHKLNMLEYRRNSELIADAELLFSNCYLYNEEGSEVYKCGEKLEKIFEKLCRERNLIQFPDAPLPKKSRTVL